MLEVRDLCKSFETLPVTYQVSFSVPKGGRHAVIGPNGAGKTTLFNLLTGEIRADSGSVLLDGADITRLTPDARVRAGLGRSFQQNNLFAHMTVRENLAVACSMHAGVARVFWKPFGRFHAVLDTATQLAERIGVTDALETPVRQLSYGTQRQIEVGLALALDPKVLLLDEPTAGMSPEETTAMQALIEGLPGDLTVIIIEHDMDVVFGLAERITVLDYGQILFEGDAAEVHASDLVRERYLGGGA
jgi:branched-chain amino acid transport system ATP-binding protein